MTQRTPREHDPVHLAFVRTKPCCVCGRSAPSAAAHVKFSNADILARWGKRSYGMAEKPSDRWTVPLCDPYAFSPGGPPWCHQQSPGAQHEGNEEAFWERVGVDPHAVASMLWAASGGPDRQCSTPPKRTTKARPPKPRRAISREKKPWPKRPMPKGRGFPKRNS